MRLSPAADTVAESAFVLGAGAGAGLPATAAATTAAPQRTSPTTAIERIVMASPGVGSNPTP